MRPVVQSASQALTHPVLPATLFILSIGMILLKIEPSLSVWGLLLSSGGWLVATLLRWSARRGVSAGNVVAVPSFAVVQPVVVVLASIVGIVIGIVTMALTSSSIGVASGALASALIGIIGAIVLRRQIRATQSTNATSVALIAGGALSVAAILSLLALLGFGSAT